MQESLLNWPWWVISQPLPEHIHYQDARSFKEGHVIIKSFYDLNIFLVVPQNLSLKQSIGLSCSFYINRQVTCPLSSFSSNGTIYLPLGTLLATKQVKKNYHELGFLYHLNVKSWQLETQMPWLLLETIQTNLS